MPYSVTKVKNIHPLSSSKDHNSVKVSFLEGNQIKTLSYDKFEKRLGKEKMPQK